MHADGDTDFAALLADVLLDLAPVVLEAPPRRSPSPRRSSPTPTASELAVGTNLGFDARTATAEQAALATGAGVLGFVVDATVVHDQGASDAQELGYSPAVGVQALRALTDAWPLGRRGRRPPRVPATP